MKDFTIYKKAISLPDFLKNHGFSDYKRGSTKNNPKFTNGDITVVVKRVNGNYYYYDVNSPDKKLTILDFVQQELSKSNGGELVPLPIVANELDKYIETGQNILPELSSYNLNSTILSTEDVNRLILHLSKTGNPDFLIKRGISEKTFTHKNFKDCIFFRKINHPNRVSHDIAFVMHGLGETRAISYRGIRDGMEESFKGFHGPKMNNIASSVLDKSKPLDAIFIGESMIDCMAHFELNFKELNSKNVLYLSSEGSITPDQIQLFQIAINNNPSKQISTVFDNDLYGCQASTLIHSQIIVPSSRLHIKDSPSVENFLNLTKAEVPIISKKFTKASILFNIPTSNLTEITEYLQSAIYPVNSSLSLPKDKFTLKNISTDKNKTKIEMNFPNNTFGWKAANQVIIDFKFGKSELFLPEFPKNKDFNLDLLDYKGITSVKNIKNNGISLD